MSTRTYRFNLRGHLRLCEMNYVRLRRVLGSFDESKKITRSVCIDGLTYPMIIRVKSFGRYTSRVTFAQDFGSKLPPLDVKMHAYHDMKIAEVVAYQGHHHFRVTYKFPNPEMHNPNEKELVNGFVSELLAKIHADGLAPESELRTLIGAINDR